MKMRKDQSKSEFGNENGSMVKAVHRRKSGKTLNFQNNTRAGQRNKGIRSIFVQMESAKDRICIFQTQGT
jgi:hypothetical protein